MARPLKWPPVFPLERGLVLWLPFDDRSGARAYDRSGKGNHGTLIGPTWQVGQRVPVLYFDGNKRYVQVPHNPTLSVTTLFTIEAWVYPLGTPSYNPRIVAKESAAGRHSYSLEFRDTTRLVDLYISGGRRVTSTNALPLNAWTFVVGTYSQSEGYARVYLNGSLDMSTAYNGQVAVTTNDVLIGNNPTKVRDFYGRMFGVRIYNRALNAAEIKRHYESEIMNVRY